MSIERFDLRHVSETPWKNGGGGTRELVCWPLGAASEADPDTGREGFLWRVSVATIARSGSFSVFPGIDRVITLLSGDGVELTSRNGNWQHRLDRRLMPYAFLGEEEIECSMLGGESTDFNVMTRRGRAVARVELIRSLHVVPPSPHGLLMVVSGTWEIEAENPHELGLEVGEGVWWADEAQDITLTPQSASDVMLAVWIDEVHDEAVSV
jgi:environmental stress-induced protein Ves